MDFFHAAESIFENFLELCNLDWTRCVSSENVRGLGKCLIVFSFSERNSQLSQFMSAYLHFECHILL